MQELAITDHSDEIRTILDAAPFPLLIRRMSDGKVLYANERLAGLLGLTLGELVGSKTPDLYSDPAERKLLLEKHTTTRGASTRRGRRRASARRYVRALRARHIRSPENPHGATGLALSPPHCFADWTYFMEPLTAGLPFIPRAPITMTAFGLVVFVAVNSTAKPKR